MAYNKTQVRVWDLTSDNSGVVLNNEVARLYGNINGVVVGDADNADRTILTAENIGIWRFSNGNAEKTAKAFGIQNPVEIVSAAHGMSTGDYIRVNNSSDNEEIGNHNYQVTVIDPGTFSLVIDNSAGAGGTLDYYQAVVVTMDAAGSNTDKQTVIEKADAIDAPIQVTDGSSDWFLNAQNERIELKSDGTNWIRTDNDLRGGIISPTGIVQIDAEFLLDSTDRIEKGDEITAIVDATWTDIPLESLPENTVSVFVEIQLGTLDSSDFDRGASVKFSDGNDANNQAFALSAKPAEVTPATLWTLVHRWSAWVSTKNQTNTLRAWIQADSLVIFNILGYKTKKV